MSVDVTKMPKLGFGMMRLPEKDGELDLEQICKMVDAYLASGMNYLTPPICTAAENRRAS